MIFEELTHEQVKNWDKEIYGEEEVFINRSFHEPLFSSSSQMWKELGVREI